MLTSLDLHTEIHSTKYIYVCVIRKYNYIQIYYSFVSDLSQVRCAYKTCFSMLA